MKKFLFILISFFVISASYAATISWTFDGVDQKGSVFGDNQGSLFIYLQTSTSPISVEIENGVLVVKNGTYMAVDHASDGYFTGSERNVELGTAGSKTFLLILVDTVASTLSEVTSGFYNSITKTTTYTTDPPNLPSIEFSMEELGGENNPLKTSLEVVPEPTTLALLALGIAAFGLKRKVS